MTISALVLGAVGVKVEEKGVVIVNVLITMYCIN